MTPERRSLVAVVALALAVRTAWSLAVPVSPVSDSGVYDVLARHICSGIGYAFEPGKPTAYWPVGTSAVYAALYWIFGVHYAPIVVLNVLLGGLTVALVMALARRWYGPRPALFAGLALALWPGQVMFSTILASELLFNAGWVAALYVSGRKDWGAVPRLTGVAALLAGASLVRPTALPMAWIFAWIEAVGPGEREVPASRRILHAGVGAAVATAMMILILSPWLDRNRRLLGGAVLSTNGGSNLWMGNNPNSTGGYMPPPTSITPLNNVEYDRALGREAIAFMKAHPGHALALAGRKIYITHDRETHGVTWNAPGLTERFGAGCLLPLKAACTAYWWAMLGLGLLGAREARRRAGPWRWIGEPSLVLWGYFFAVHAIIVGGDRYHYPSVPAIAALAGLALATLRPAEPLAPAGTSSSEWPHQDASTP